VQLRGEVSSQLDWWGDGVECQSKKLILKSTPGATGLWGGTGKKCNETKIGGESEKKGKIYLCFDGGFGSEKFEHLPTGP